MTVGRETWRLQTVQLHYFNSSWILELGILRIALLNRPHQERASMLKRTQPWHAESKQPPTNHPTKHSSSQRTAFPAMTSALSMHPNVVAVPLWRSPQITRDDLYNFFKTASWFLQLQPKKTTKKSAFPERSPVSIISIQISAGELYITLCNFYPEDKCTANHHLHPKYYFCSTDKWFVPLVK